MSNGGKRVPMCVRSVSATDPTDIAYFPSLAAAGASIIGKLSSKTSVHQKVQKVLDSGVLLGDRLWYVSSKEEYFLNKRVEPIPEEVAMFNLEGDKGIRITNEVPRRVSVFDFIEAVTGNVNPPNTFSTLIENHPAISQCTAHFQFPGRGQKPTPVTNVEGLVLLMNLLPGERCAQFRVAHAKTLVRYLGGDETLVEEIRAMRSAQENMLPDNPMRLFGEAVENVAVLPNALAGAGAAAAAPLRLREIDFRFVAPRLKEQTLDLFLCKKCVYLVPFSWNGLQYIKYGKSDDIFSRITTHLKELPDAKVFSVVPSSDIVGLENAFKMRMLSKGFLTEVTIKGKQATELLLGIHPEDADDILCELENERTADDNALKLKRMEHETKMMEMHQAERKLELDHENKKLDNAREIEVKKLDNEVRLKLIELVTQVIASNVPQEHKTAVLQLLLPTTPPPLARHSLSI